MLVAVVIAIAVIGTSAVTYLAWLKNQARQARFTIDVLEDVIFGYQQVTGKRVDSLRSLPDFDVISRMDGLRVAADDLRDGIHGAYVYDWQFLEDGRYLLTALPLGRLAPQVSYVIADDRRLRFGMGFKADDDVGYSEIFRWPFLVRTEMAESQ